jgi:hypothetical protein
MSQTTGTKQRLYTCCRLPEGSLPCDRGVHVFQVSFTRT